MKKKVLPLAVGAATAVTMSAAHAAMYINDKGMGETLIFPFYSAESGNNTAIHVVNTTAGTKAVKVRIMEAENSQEVLDFNLYMSPADHFSFGIVAEGDGAKIITSDNSCTVPAIPADGQPFVSFKYDGTIGSGDSSEGDAETGEGAYDNTGIERTRVGYVEVIEMGQLDPDAAPALDTTPASDTYTPINAVAAITHGADGVPANCDLLVTAWSKIDDVDGTWYAQATDDTTQATAEFLTNWAGGGLYGYARVLNVAEGSAFGYDAVAIASHVASGASGSAMHYRPGSIYPNFGDSAMDTQATVNVAGTAVTLDFDGDYPAEAVERVQALNSMIMATAIHNDFVTDSAINAETDWITTFPTKHFHINGVTEGIEPFATLWNGQSACEDTNLSPIDREEQTPVVPETPTTSAGPDFSPAPPPGAGPAAPASTDVPLCYESTVVMMAETSAVKADDSVGLGVNASLHADDGWATMSFDPADLFDDLPFSCDVDGDTQVATPCDRVITAGTHTMTGLPVVGFAVQKYVNNSATPGGAGYYAMATDHKTSVTVSAVP